AGVRGGRPEPPFVTVVLAKGWSNYLCLRRLEQLPGPEEVDPAVHASLRAVVREVERGAPGERQRLPASDGAWSHVVADPMACGRQTCPFYGDCWFFKARRELEQADVIVTNHSLLLADLALRLDGAQGILPAYDRLVMDEAHHLEEVATEHMGHAVTRLGLNQLLERLYRSRGRAEEAGLLPGLRTRVARLDLDPDRKKLCLTRIDRELLARVVDLREAGQELAEAAAALVGGQEGRYRLKAGFPAEPAEERLFQAGRGLAGELRHWASSLREVEELLRADGGGAWSAQDSMAIELGGAASRLQSLAESLEFCLFPDSGDWIHWAEAGRRDSGLAAAPLEVSRLLARELYPKLKTLVMTSATLAVSRRTEFFERRVGLGFHCQRVSRLCVDSPFDYREQAFLGLATDVGEPGGEGFAARSLPGLLTLAQCLGGSTFLLVTSWQQLQQFATLLRRPLQDMGVRLLEQGQAPSAQLLQEFRAPGPAFLVGTDSFWEGVDVPGEALRCVVLARLPFRVPTDPVVEARSHLVEQQGYSAFEAFQLPLAILKLRQGFGRLIRTTTDRGLVYILDHRVHTRKYGQRFLQALPQCTRNAGPFESLVEQGLDWLTSRESARTRR
ncbi:MAG: helicase C-terminal domain-containing protein, partial [Candidatus Eremiobacterota bacterium]